MAAIVLFIGEILSPGFLLACFGIACLVAGVVAYYDMGFGAQMLTFSISTLVVFFGIRPFVLKYLHTSPETTKTNVEALIGKIGVVSERIDPATAKGRTIVGGEDWRAIAIDDTEIAAGDKIEVVRVEGTKLFVKPVTKREEQ